MNDLKIYLILELLQQREFYNLFNFERIKKQIDFKLFNYLTKINFFKAISKSYLNSILPIDSRFFNGLF
jgi:hypothetical protein